MDAFSRITNINIIIKFYAKVLKLFAKIAVREPWCPGADLNHRHEVFHSTALFLSRDYKSTSYKIINYHSHSSVTRRIKEWLHADKEIASKIMLETSQIKILNGINYLNLIFLTSKEDLSCIL